MITPTRPWSLGAVLAEQEVDALTQVLIVRPDAAVGSSRDLDRAARDFLRDLRRTARQARANGGRLLRAVRDDIEGIGAALQTESPEPRGPAARPRPPRPPSRPAGDFHTRHAARRSRGKMVSTEEKLYRAGTPQDVTSVRAKSQRHRKSTADRWNQ